MAWIKNNPHQLALSVLSVALIGAAAVVLMNAQALPEQFSAVQSTPVPNNIIPPLELEPVQQAEKKVQTPSRWTSASQTAGGLFVPQRYIVDEGKLTPLVGGKAEDYLTKKEIPFDWFLKYKLNPLDPSVVTQDPDSDGFYNADEWRHETDPNDKASHPPYYTKLFVKEYIRVQFLLKFQSYDLDPKNPKNNTFFLNTLTLRTPTLTLGIGDKVPRTPYQLEKFEQKTAMNASIGVEEDVSELTLKNIETGDSVVLILNKITDSPESFALFSYQWPAPPQDIRVKKLQEFVLRPNVQERYKLLDIKETEALIQLPSGEKYTVPKLPPGMPAR